MNRLEQLTSKQRLIVMLSGLVLLAICTLVLVDMPMRAEQAKQQQEAASWLQEERASRLDWADAPPSVAASVKKVGAKYPDLGLSLESTEQGSFILSGSGSYVDLYKALAELEHAQPQALWSKWSISQSSDFKKTNLRTTVSLPLLQQAPK